MMVRDLRRVVIAVVAKAHCRMQMRCYDTEEVDLQDERRKPEEASA